jgi:hypothetical protein
MRSGKKEKAKKKKSVTNKRCARMDGYWPGGGFSKRGTVVGWE